MPTLVRSPTSVDCLVVRRVPIHVLLFSPFPEACVVRRIVRERVRRVGENRHGIVKRGVIKLER